MKPKLLTTGQLARALGVSPSTVRRWCANGMHSCRRPGERTHRRIVPMFAWAYIEKRRRLQRRIEQQRIDALAQEVA